MRILLVHNYYGSSAPSGENKVFEAERACRRPTIGMVRICGFYRIDRLKRINRSLSGSFGTIGYCSPLVLLGSIALFVFVLNCVPPCFGSVVATRLAALVFGVYLWHPLFKGISMAVVSRLASPQMWLVFPITATAAFGGMWLASRFRVGAVLLGVK